MLNEGQQQILFQKMAELDGKTVKEVAAMFDGLNVNDASQPDLFSQPSIQAQSDEKDTAAQTQAAKLMEAAIKLEEMANAELKTRPAGKYPSTRPHGCWRHRASREGGSIGANHLSGVKNGADVRTLDNALKNAMRETDRELSFVEREHRKGRQPTPDDLRHAVLPFPAWGIGGSDRSKVINAIKGKRGAPALADKIRNSNRPEAEIIKQLNKMVGEKETSYLLGWWDVEKEKDIARFKRMGIENDTELRLALNEYVLYRDGPHAEDPVKAAERAIVGQKVGIDFFPS